MNTVITLLQALLGLFFVVGGAKKLSGFRLARDDYVRLRYPVWLMRVVGFLDLMAGAGMLASIHFPALASVAGAAICLLALGSLYTHLIRARSNAWIVSAGVFVLSGVVVYERLMALAIGLLLMATAPDPAGFAPVSATPVLSLQKYAPELFESILIDPQGAIYLTMATTGQILKITADRKQSIVATLPIGKFDLMKFQGILGTLVMDADGNLFSTVVASDPKNKGIWKTTPDGQSALWASLPAASAPNGITIDATGNLYVADSLLMCVWRVPFKSRSAEKWATDDLLGKGGNRFLPGPNGVKLWKDELYVSVSNTRRVIRVPVRPDGSAGKAEIYVDGIPADDFAFDIQGNIYLTTHFNNTIVRVSPEGQRAIIASKDQGVVGPTSVAFGQLPSDRNKLFVISDGGFGNPLSHGTPNVVQLDIGIQGLPIP